MIPIVLLAVVLGIMLVELRISQRNERILHTRGATAPPDPVYGTMRWAYPGAFVAMALEGAALGLPHQRLMLAGVAVFLAGKVLKAWAIATLGERWTFRVLVIPGAALVSGGPYRLMRHPNYVGVLGELLGMALMMGARLSGPVSIIFFSWLLLRRIDSEEHALSTSAKASVDRP